MAKYQYNSSMSKQEKVPTNNKYHTQIIIASVEHVKLGFSTENNVPRKIF
jgi:hypothetical protein